MENGLLKGNKEIIHDIQIGDAILSALKSKPNFIGQTDAETGEQITFQEMRVNSVKCALWLRKKEIGDGDTISICIRNQMITYIPLLASIYNGAIISPWDHKCLSNNIQILQFLLMHKSKIIFVDDAIIALRLQLVTGFLWQYRREEISPKIIVLKKNRNFDSLELILNGDFDEKEIDEFSCVNKDPMVSMFTDNLTTYPNVIQISPLIFMIPSNHQVPMMFVDDVGLWYGPLYWTHSILLTIRTIISYVTAIKSSKFSAINLYEMIEKYKVTWVFLDSFICNKLQTDVITKYDLSSLREFVFDNSKQNCDIYEELVKSLPNVFITQVYSASKTKLICAYQRNSKNTKSIGQIANNIELKFLHPIQKRPMGPYLVSEIWYRFLYGFCSDFNDDTCTFPNCHKKERNVLKHQDKYSMWEWTGDFGSYDLNGNIYIMKKKFN